MQKELEDQLCQLWREQEVSEWLVSLAKPLGGWKIFHTATFSPDRAARSAETALRRYQNFMQERDRRKVTWLVGVEPNPDHNHLNPGFHCHGLWAATDEIWRTSSFKRWANQWGNNNVDPVKVVAHVQSYVSKYCLKENGLWSMQINDRNVFLQQQLVRQT